MLRRGELAPKLRRIMADSSTYRFPLGANWLVAAMALLILSGCSGRIDVPLLNPRLSNTPSAVNARTPARLPVPRSGAVQVAPGDTVYSISRRYGVSTRDIIQANRLKPPYRLMEGSRVMLPTPRTYVVAHGDTIFGIARRFGVEMGSLVRLNRLAPPYQIHPGQSLVMPTVSPPSLRHPAKIARINNPLSLPALTPAPRRKGSAPPMPIRRPVPRFKFVAPSSKTRSPPPVTSTPPSTPLATVSAQSTGKVERSAKDVRSALLRLPSRAGTRFARPLRGKMIAGFGSQAGGLHNDGINILAAGGLPIVAAENGVVAYAGNELRGFGNLLLVKHAEGWTTAYAHADRLLVGRGDRVRKGQKIATVGASGNVSRPQLHFELRKDGRAVDPTRHF